MVAAHLKTVVQTVESLCVLYNFSRKTFLDFFKMYIHSLNLATVMQTNSSSKKAMRLIDYTMKLVVRTNPGDAPNV